MVLQRHRLLKSHRTPFLRLYVCVLLAALTGAAAGQLAPITEEEFATLPSFVQSQIEREFANEALSALKQCIIDTELKPAEVVLTPSQLRYYTILKGVSMTREMFV